MLREKIFEYPLDTKALIRKKRELKRRLEKQQGLLTKRIAILGGSTTNEVVDQLELFLLYQGIKPEFYQSEYGQYETDALFGNEMLDKFRPDVIYIHTSWRNLKEFPEVGDDEATVEAKLHREYQRFLAIWRALEKRFDVPVVQNNFERPLYRLLGNRDIWDRHGASNFISRLNQLFYERARADEHLLINDIDYLASEYGLSAWHDPQYWYLYKYALALEAVPYLAKNVADMIKAIYGRNKKLLALDCDQTLWGGIISEDGVEHIKIGKETASGELYTEFQEYLLQLKKMGILLAINSKNDEENVLLGLQHADSILKPDDFVEIEANWENKDENLVTLSRKLALGTDSMVFVDDSPQERDLVRQSLPDVAVPEMSIPEEYIYCLDRNGYFESVRVAKEDLKKTELYRARAEASALMQRFSHYEDFLASLQMKAEITSFQPEMLDRIAQLTNKTNQFNLTAQRYTLEEISGFERDPAYLCLAGRLRDRFADQGIVTAVIGEKRRNHLLMRLWLMSCRVLRRGLEDLMMNVVVEEARKMGCEKIYGIYHPTKRNGMVQSFYPERGFQCCEEVTTDEERGFVLSVDRYHPRDTKIVLEGIVEK